MTELVPIHFFDQPIEVVFDTPPAREKSPDCPNGFIWEEKTYRCARNAVLLSDLRCYGKMALICVLPTQPLHRAAVR